MAVEPSVPRPGIRKPRDRARIAAWSAVAVVAVSFGLAGVVWKPAPDVAVLLSSAEFALRMDSLDFAGEQIGAVLAREPENGDALVLRALLAFKRDDPTAAERDLETVLASAPERGDANLYMGHVEFERRAWGESLAHYRLGEAAIEGTHNLPLQDEFQVRMGLLRLATGDFAGAEAVAARLIAASGRPAAGFLIRAFSRLGEGDDTGFGQALARAYSEDESEPLFRQSRKMLLEAIPWASAF